MWARKPRPRFALSHTFWETHRLPNITTPAQYGVVLLPFLYWLDCIKAAVATRWALLPPCHWITPSRILGMCVLIGLNRLTVTLKISCWCACIALPSADKDVAASPLHPLREQQ